MALGKPKGKHVPRTRKKIENFVYLNQFGRPWNTDPWLRQTIKDFDMYALEIPTDPDTGVDLYSVKRIIAQEKIAACIVNPNCQNPLGFIMPDDNKQKLLGMLCDKAIPIIENDVCGELYFGEYRPNPLKKWDTNDNVIYCSSFSKVLAPGLRVGWVVSGKFKESIKRMKLNRSLVSPTLNQALVASYLKEGTYHRHLRKLRQTIKLQYSYCAAALTKYFPETIKMTAPSGGQSIWIELPNGTKGREVYYEAKKKGISILPGFLCTSFDIFDQYIRIGFGGFWDKTMERAIEQLGDKYSGYSAANTLRKSFFILTMSQLRARASLSNVFLWYSYSLSASSWSRIQTRLGKWLSDAASSMA